MQRAMLWPMFAMAALTFTVATAMFRRRIREIRARRIPLRELATSRGRSMLEDVVAADNYANLLEMPVLFYALCLVVAASGTASALSVGLAWAYVALRALHSAIHLGSNHVFRRFQAFAASCVVLVACWLEAAYRLLQ
jgi:hypothetical protein